MKKFSLLLSVVVIAALFLAACGGVNNNNLGNNQVPGDTTLMPEGDGLATPESDLGAPADDEGLIPETGSEDLLTETATPEFDLDATPTVETGVAGETETPVVPQTGQPGGEFSVHSYGLLSQLVGANVQSSDGQAVGQVTGVLIERPLASDGLTVETPAVEGDTTQGSDAQTTPTPEFDAGSSFAIGSGPRVVYLLVNLNGSQTLGDTTTGSDAAGGSAQATPTPAVGTDTGTNPLTQQTGGSDVLIPFDAFDFSGLELDIEAHASGQFGSSEGEQQGDLAATPTPGLDDGTGSLGLDGVIVLNATADAVSGAPTLNEISTGAIRVPGWDAQLSQYWSQHGFGLRGGDIMLPESDADSDALGTDLETDRTHDVVLLRDEIFSYNLSDETGQSIGTIDDLVIDLNTGEIVFATLTGQGTLNGRMYLVPFSHLTWQGQQPSGDGFANPGGFNTNFPPGSMDPGMPWYNDTSSDV